MVFHKAEDAVYAPFVETELVEGFGFFELAVAFIGRGGEVDAADRENSRCLILVSTYRLPNRGAIRMRRNLCRSLEFSRQQTCIHSLHLMNGILLAE